MGRLVLAAEVSFFVARFGVVFLGFCCVLFVPSGPVSLI